MRKCSNPELPFACCHHKWWHDSSNQTTSTKLNCLSSGLLEELLDSKSAIGSDAYSRHRFPRSVHLLLSYSPHHRLARLHVKPNFTPQPLTTTDDLLRHQRLCAQALVYVPQCRRTILDFSLHLCRALHGHSSLPYIKILRKYVRAPVHYISLIR